MVTPYKHEKSLFTIACILAALFWILIVVGTFGIVLIYVLLGLLVYLFVQSAFISSLKGTGVRISAQQYPDLYGNLTESCRRIGLAEVPDAYLLRTDFFNALATRFLGRNFIVLFTDVLDALEDQPGAVNFYIGHELGHIHRKHLNWHWFIMPAMILPLLGTALRRAEEYTCDRYGVACCDSDEDVRAALAAIAAGNSRWKSINADAYLGQIALTSGFWMSFNELTNDYPWLTKRMATAMALRQGREITHPHRHWFAKFLAIFVPRFGSGGGGVSLLVGIAIIGILAAVAIPSYQDYTFRAQITQALGAARSVQDAVEQYYSDNAAWPTSLAEVGIPDGPVVDPAGKFEIDLYENGMLGIDISAIVGGTEKYVVLSPAVEDGSIQWSCSGQDVEARYLPTRCR